MPAIIDNFAAGRPGGGGPEPREGLSLKLKVSLPSSSALVCLLWTVCPRRSGVLGCCYGCPSGGRGRGGRVSALWRDGWLSGGCGETHGGLGWGSAGQG